ncbi:MAG: hypothetical protein IPM98_03320 [Lewinellaceae bacterium]|nr:hypothetical protein [Lewinellaceae bacterium]
MHFRPFSHANTPSSPPAWAQTLCLGTAAYAILLVLAAVFYLERMAVLDMAFQTFQILRTGEVQIQSGRFGAVGTQVFPWAAQAAGLPLKGVLMSYSLGHVLYYFGVFLMVTLVLRQWKWGLVLILLATLMTAHTFYWLSEMPQGLAFLVLVLAWLHHKERLSALRWWAYPLLAAGLVTAFYFHPMVLYAMLFCAAYFFLEKPRSPIQPLYLLALAIFLATVFVKYKILKLDWYDAQALERAKAFGALWPNWFDIQSNRDFLRWCRTDYYMIPVLTVLNAAFFLWKKQGLRAALVTVAPVGFVLLVNIPFHPGDNQFYLENLYLPLGLFVAVPLVFAVLPGLLPEKRHWIPVAAIAAIGLFRIVSVHRPWTNRLHWEQDFLEKTAHREHRKLLLTEEQASMDTLVLSWGTPYEFLLLSALEHPDSARCILVDEASHRFDPLLAQPGLFLGEFKNYSFDELPRRYFNLTDTSAYVRW